MSGGGRWVSSNNPEFVPSAAARAVNGEVKVGKGGMVTVERECVRPRDGNVLAFRAYPRAHHPSLIPTVITCAMEAARAPRGWMRSKILIWEVVHIFGRLTFIDGQPPK